MAEKLDPQQMRQAANAYGMSTADLQQILMNNPQLVEKLSEAFGADLMSDRYKAMGGQQVTQTTQQVGPYGATQATPWMAAAQGLERGIGRVMEKRGVDTQKGAQQALIDGLRNMNKPKSSGFAGPMGSPRAAGAENIMGSRLTEGPSQPPMRYESGAGMAQSFPAPEQPMAQPVPMPQQGPPPGPPPGPPMGGPPPGAGGPPPGPPPQMPPMPGAQTTPGAPGKPPGMSWPEYQAMMMRGGM